MEAKELERIEAYLAQTMSEAENEIFEKELRDSKELAEKTKSVAYILHSIHLVGLKRDNERIGKIHLSASGDYKRYITSIAAMLVVVLTFASVVSVPVYRHVVKPVIEKILRKSPSPSKPSNSPIVLDTIVPMQMDTLDTDTIIMRTDEKEMVSEVEKKEIPVEQKELPLDTDTLVIEKTEPDTLEREEVKTTLVEVVPPKPANRIVSYSQLKNYWFGDVIAKRVGKDVVCTFVMKNEIEDAEIQMHSARAKDGNGKNYLAKSCLLNGKSKRIVEKWKKEEEHVVTITIVDVPLDVAEFENVSFSFQSAGDSLKQKSQSIILKVGEMN